MLFKYTTLVYLAALIIGASTAAVASNTTEASDGTEATSPGGCCKKKVTDNGCKLPFGPADKNYCNELSDEYPVCNSCRLKE